MRAFVLFLGMGLVWAIGTPLFDVPDEPAYVVKAASVVRGEFVPAKRDIPDEGRGALLRGGFTTEVHVPLSYTWNTTNIPLCHMFDPRVPAGCSPAFVDDSRPAVWTTFIGRYPPPVSWVVGLPSLIDTGATSIYLMRFVSAALCAALLATALACARDSRRFRLGSLGLALAVTPQVFFLAGSVNPNGIEISAAICLWIALGVVALDDRPTIPRHLLWTIAVSGGLLAWARPLSMVWTVLAAIAVLGCAASKERLSIMARSRAVRLTTACVALIAAGAAAWTFATDALGNLTGDDPRGLGLVDAFRHSFRRSFEYLEQMLGVFGWRNVDMPSPAYWLWGGMVLALVLLTLRYAPRRFGIGVLTLLALTILLPSILQAPAAAQAGFPWSGRYGLPFAVGLPILSGLAVGASGRLGRRGVRQLAGTVVTGVALVHIVAHVISTRRFVVGIDGPLFYLDQHGWDPPLPAWFLLMATIALAGGLAMLTLRVALDDEPLRAWRRHPPTSEPVFASVNHAPELS